MKRLGIGVTLGIVILAFLGYLITPTATLYHSILRAERGLAGLATHKIVIDELEVEYLRGGNGAPLLLLHGFGADKDNWNRLAGHLVEHFDVVAIDLPGFGNSTKDIELAYDVMSQVERVKRITEALNLTQFHLAGSSMGGYIAGNYAVKNPSTVESLWLISPFGVESALLSDMFQATKKGMQPAVLPRNQAEFYSLFDFLFVDIPFVPSPIVQYLAEQAALNAKLNAKIFEQIHRMNNGEPTPDMPLDKVMQGYPGPVMVSWGQQDRVLHVSGATALQQTMPQAKLDIAANLGHLPMIEAPKETANAFIAFTAALH